MPIIKIWCLPANQTEENLRDLHKSIVRAVLAVQELGLKSENDMTVLFPPDMMSYGLGTEVIVEISGLFIKPERTQAVKQRLARYVGLNVHDCYPDTKVECFVKSFDPAEGFWTSSPLKKIQDLKKQLSKALPYSEILIDKDHPDWIDIKLGDKHISIQYRQEMTERNAKGYVVWHPKPLEEQGYGEGPDETFANPEEVLKRVQELLPK